MLRLGLIMVIFSVLFATGVAVVVSLHNEAPAEVDGAQAEPAAAETTPQENKFDIGQKLEIDDEPQPSSDPAPPRENPAPPPEKKSAPPPEERSSSRGIQSLPVSGDWPHPTREELSWIRQPRYFHTDPDAVMYLTIEALGLYGVPVLDSFDEAVLSRGVMHLPDTAFPWDRSSEKNVFLAGHRTGVPGTDGRLLFFDLDKLQSGDEIYLEDPSGRAYRYRVTDLFKVGPYDGWVADTLVGRDLLTLQTCTYPTFEERLIVRADRA